MWLRDVEKKIALKFLYTTQALASSRTKTFVVDFLYTTQAHYITNSILHHRSEMQPVR